MNKKPEKKPIDLTPGPGEEEAKEFTVATPEVIFTEPAPRVLDRAPAGYKRWKAGPGVTGIATDEGTWPVINGWVDIPVGAYPAGYGICYFNLDVEPAE